MGIREKLTKIVKTNNWEALLELLGNEKRETAIFAARAILEMPQLPPDSVRESIQGKLMYLLNGAPFDPIPRAEMARIIGEIADWLPGKRCLAAALNQAIAYGDQNLTEQARKAFDKLDQVVIALPEHPNPLRGLQDEIEEMVRRFMEILRDRPKIFGKIIDGNEETRKECVALLGQDETQMLLNVDGRAYDYNMNDPSKWKANTTRAQLDEILKHWHGRWPGYVLFWIEDETNDAPYHSLTLKFPWEFVLRFLFPQMSSGGVIDVPYEIYGGKVRVRVPAPMPPSAPEK